MANSDLSPRMSLTIDVPSKVFGTLASPSETVSWVLNQSNVPGSIPGTVRSVVQMDGFALSPDGQFLIQAPYYNWYTTGAGAWTAQGGDTGTYKSLTDQGTGAISIQQTNGSNTVASNTVFDFAHNPDLFGAQMFRLYRPAPTATLAAYNAASYNWYLVLNATTESIDGLVQFRIAVEAGSPIHLDKSTDGGNTWRLIDQASNLSDSETYLNRCNRVVTFDVMPFFDISYWDDAPDSFQFSDNPPDTMWVVINNGDAVLTYSAYQGTYASGYPQVISLGGQWGLSIADHEFVPNPTANLAVQQYPRAFTATPNSHLLGYRPYGSSFEVLPQYQDNGTGPGGFSALGASLAVSTEYNLDVGTGYSRSSVAVSKCSLDYPPIFNNNGYGFTPQTFNEAQIVAFGETHTFDQINGIRRSFLRIVLQNWGGGFDPNSQSLGVRAAQFNRGWYDALSNTNDVTTGITGLTTFDDRGRPSYEWMWQGKQPYLVINISDRLIADQPCGYMLPMDGQCHYYVIRQCGYRLGFSDEWMQSFPFCERDSNCNHYHLPYGTTFAPLYLPDQAQTLISFMLTVRALAQEYDPLGSGQTLPLIIYVDSLGNLIYEPIPAAILNLWEPGGQAWQNPGKFYSAYDILDPEGFTNLNQISFTLRSRANLSNIRNNVCFTGLNSVDGSFIQGVFNNPTTAGGPDSSPYVPGYIGMPRPWWETNRLFTTPGVVQAAMAIAVPQVSFPIIESDFSTLLQAGLFPVTGWLGNPVLAISDQRTQGDNGTGVPYWCNTVQHSYGQQGQSLTMQTDASFRILGEYGG